MSNLMTLFALIGLMATVGLVGAKQGCQPCLKQAAQIKPILSVTMINDWVANTTRSCQQEKRQSCMRMMESSESQLRYLLVHSEPEFCQWLGVCESFSIGLPQMISAKEHVLHPNSSDAELHCLECQTAGGDLKNLLTPQIISQSVRLGTNDCLNNPDSSQLDACLAQVTKLSYALSYLMNHKAEEYCNWSGVCENKYAAYDVAEAWKDIESHLMRTQCDKCMQKASQDKKGLTPQTIDSEINANTAKCNEIADKIVKDRCLSRVAQHRSYLMALLNENPREFCESIKAC